MFCSSRSDQVNKIKKNCNDIGKGKINKKDRPTRGMLVRHNGTKSYYMCCYFVWHFFKLSGIYLRCVIKYRDFSLRVLHKHCFDLHVV